MSAVQRLFSFALSPQVEGGELSNYHVVQVKVALDALHSLAKADLLLQAKTQHSLAADAHVLLAGDECSGRTCRSTNTAADEGSFASGSQGADERTSAGSSADPAQVALLVRTPARYHFGGRKRNRMLIHYDAVESESQSTGVTQPS